MKQRVIGEENQSTSQPFFGYIWIRQEGVVHPLDNFDVACRKDRSMTFGTEKPSYEARVGTKILRQILQLLRQLQSAFLIDRDERAVV